MGTPLNYKAKLDIEGAKKSALELQKIFKEVGIKSSDGFSGKPLSEYQAGLLKIKQETLDLAKAKAEQARIDKENAAANKSASLATQAALKEEVRLRKEASASPRKVDFGNSSAEVASSLASNSTGGVVNPAFTQYLKQVKADFDAGKISAAQYTAELERYSTVLVEGSNQARNAAKATKDLTLSKKELEKIAAQEKLNAQQNAAALKNSVREMNAAKGSIEQRRAALIRLNTVYDNLNANERNSASGQRLKGIVGSLTTQVKTLEAETGRAQRNVGNYTSAFAGGAQKAFSALKTVANILPGVGLAGLVGFAIEPIMNYIKSLDLFKAKATDTAKIAAASASEYTKALSDTTALKTSVDEFNKGTISKTELVKRFNQSLGQTVGELKTAQQVEDFYNKQSANFVKATLLRAEANAALELSTKKASEALARQVDSASIQDYAKSIFKAFGQGAVLSISSIKENANNEKLAATVALKDASKEYATLYDTLKKKADAFAKSSGLNFNGKPEGEDKKAKAAREKAEREAKKQQEADLKEATKFYSDLLKVEEDYYRSKLSASEIEQLDLDNKYNDLLAREKNTADDVLKIYEAKEIEQKQLTEKYASDFDKAEKERYAAAFEAALTHEQAVARINKDYTDKAIALRSKLGKDATVEQKRELDAQIGVLNGKWQAVLEGEKQTAYQKTEIYRTQAAQVLELTKQQVKDQIEILKTLLDDKNIPKEVKSKIEGEINKLEFALKVGIDQNNLNTINAQIDLIKRKLSAKDENGNTLITQEEFERLKKELDDLIGKKNELEGNSGTAKSDFAKGLAENFKYLNGTASEVLTGISTDLGQISGSFGELSNALGGVNTEAGYTLDTIGQLVGVASDAAGAAASFASGDIIGGVTKTIKAISGIFSIGKKVKEMNAAARKEVEDFYANAIAGEKAYQDKLRERKLQTIRQNKLVLQGIRDEIALRKEQTSDYAKETAEIMAKLQGQSYVSAEKYTHGTWFRKAKVDKTYTSLAGKSFEELSSLLAQGKLEADAKALVERLIELEQKGYDASLALDELAKERDIVFTGTTADAIAGGIINGFKAGKKTAADFADDFGGLMEDALLSSFKSQYLDGAIEEFYKEFAKLSADGLSDAEIEALRARYAEVIASGSGLADAIKKIRGEVVEVLDEGFKTNAFSLLLQSAEETGKSIEQILKDSILEGLKAQIFTDALKPLQTKIAALYKDGRIPTKEELAAITAEYTAFIDGAKAKLKEVEDNTGLVFNDKIAEDLRAAAEKIKSEIQSISDSILDVFANSDNALQDFESKFNGMVKNTILKSLQETTLQGRLTEFYTEFQKLSTVSDGEKEAQVAKLRAQYNAIIKEGKDEYERLQDVFGVDYGSSAAKPSAAIGEGVQRITEDTANAIAGPIIGTFEQATKIANLMGKHYAIATQALDMAVKTEANTRRGANAGENALPLLNEIARNTRPKQGSSLSDSYTKLL